ncbi:NRDE family protein [Lutibacter maritimus]|uniref:Transport and Golgi organisation 2 n=1 Tax=Lutibacter maritimus TaxID=593133 RepID=A0A1I6RXU1_9FLAO|nr:NRDE family protein [Lutibacter maritimus]SFS69545.1 Transport and Golgi organisation 2 [Lutibacter maritimus]
MCTVSFVQLKDSFVLTSNRDEKTTRPTISPKIYTDKSIKLMYPKDEKAGGTWVVAKNEGTAIVLLNGAFENHKKKTNYLKSRGLVLMEMIKASNPIGYFFSISLKGVAPFTLIVFQNNKLVELKWDEKQKYDLEHSISESHIWSSSTLYNRSQRELRTQWFENFSAKNNPMSPEKILSFHKNTQPKNKKYGLVINRDDNIKTLSITQLLLKNNRIEMTYVDLENKEFIEKTSF